MLKVFFDSAEQLKGVFKFNPETYFNFTPLTSHRVGFSVLRKYPENIRFKPPKKTNGTPTTTAMLYAIYTHPEETDKPVDWHKVPLLLGVSFFSPYLATHFDYNFDDNECPTKDSVLESRKTPRPLDLQSRDEYFYDHSTQKILDETNTVVSGEEIFNKLFSDHCNTIHRLKGLKLKGKIFLRNSLDAGFGLLLSGCKWGLRHGLGRTLEDDNPLSGIYMEYTEESMRLLKTESIDISGYKASKNVIITFCFLVLSIFSIGYFLEIDSDFIKTLFSSDLRVICTTLLTLWALDHLLPPSILWVANKLIRMRRYVTSMKLKV